jgi:hypothetical protein
MISLPSWSDFGTYDESAYPELWDGVVGYWAPCLGPTATRLHDVSRCNNWGTLTNMDAATDWVVADGRYALDFDGSNDNVAVTRPPKVPQTGMERFTLSAWVMLRATYGILLNANSTTGLLVYVTTNLLGGIQIGVGATYPIYNATKLTANRWAFLVITFNSKNVKLFFNGKLDGTGTSSQLPNFGTATWRIGGVGSLETVNGQIDDVVFWDRDLGESEISRLYRLGRGGMLERRRRRRAYSQQAGFRAHYAQRNTQLIGGGLR